jgi:4-phospho-D-threonate 3-dehydrogenase / 4-phospho-D-erythronate 3-dehydrogenase
MRLAITMGDPSGISPEIIAGAIGRLGERLRSGQLSLLVIGSRAALDRAVVEAGLPPIALADEHGSSAAPVAQLPVGDPGLAVPLGQVSAAAGHFAYLAVEKGVELARAGQIAGIVTAPLNKEALNLAGHHFAGHTDMLAALTGSRDSVMMLAHGAMRVSHLTTHIPLSEVPPRLTTARLSRVLTLTEAALRDLGIEKPHIAVAALNPHAGENGLFGTEDTTVTAPLVAALRAEGHAVTGPVPGDTVFVKLRAGQFDAVVAMYHDQGHIPVKLLGFHVDPQTGKWTSLSGVNITLGLPIIRTSVDHGTAFDIAGRGMANADSLIEAIEFAENLARAREQRAEL